jgi:hypothetical protein
MAGDDSRVKPLRHVPFEAPVVCRAGRNRLREV